MFQCIACGSRVAHKGTVSEVFQVEGRRILVEHIPAEICSRCGEPTFSSETAERVRQVVHGEGQPVKTVPMDVYALQ